MKKYLIFINHQIVHKFWVLVYCFKFSLCLMWRAVSHDMSKFSKREFFSFCNTVHKLKDSTFGTPEYKKLLEGLGPALRYHYDSNRHHPEHFYMAKHRGMNLIDFVEMYLDWKAAIKKHSDGNLLESVIHNTKRFQMSKDTSCLLINSVDTKV